MLFLASLSRPPISLRPRRVRVGVAFVVAGLFAVAAPVARALPTQFAYALKVGETHRYKVTAFFNGHFPPLAPPDGPPINLKAALTYVVKVNKKDDKGTEVSFTVDNADIGILEKEPDENGKYDPANEVQYPIALSQAQQIFNVVAVLRPDGSVVSVKGGDNSSVRIDIGLDLRKLFLLTMPVAFPDKPINIASSWISTDGLLGSKAGRISYANKLTGLGSTGTNLEPVRAESERSWFGVHQQAENNILDKKDKAGKPTTDDSAAVDVTTGKAVLSGDISFRSVGGAAKPVELRVYSGKLLLNVQLTRTRTIPDPDHPDDPKETKVDVKARFFIARADKPAAPAKPAKAAKKGQTAQK